MQDAHHFGEGDEDAVRTAFLERLWRDITATGRARPLARYLERWPEHEIAVAQEFLRAVELGSGGDVAIETSEWPSIGHYRVLRLLGRGAQGLVYLAEDPILHRRVAIKVLRLATEGSAEALDSFHREASIAARLRHPGLCSVLQFGVHEGAPFLVMQLVEGDTLETRLARSRGEPCSAADSLIAQPLAVRPELEGGCQSSGPTPASDPPWELRTTLGIVAAIGDALQAAHKAGIVHRDIKPGNIALDASDNPVLLDFGLSIEGDRGTQHEGPVGTPEYMAPEQARGEPVGPASDVYSLGVVLYECVTLRRPFARATRSATLAAIASGDAPRPAIRRSGMTRDLRVVLETAMAADPNARYQAAGDFAADLRAVIEGRPVRARPPALPGRILRWGRREPLMASMVLVALLSLGFLVIQRHLSFRKLDVRLRQVLELTDLMEGIREERLPLSERLRMQVGRRRTLEHLLADTGDESRWLPRIAESLEEIGNLRYAIGDVTGTFFVRLRTLLVREIMKSWPDPGGRLERRRIVAVIHLGDVCKDRDSILLAETFYRRADEALRRLSIVHPDAIDIELDRVHSHVRLWAIALAGDRPRVADEEAREAFRLARDLQARRGESAAVLHALYYASSAMAQCAAGDEDKARQAEFRDLRLDFAKRASEADPGSLEYRRLYESTMANLVDLNAVSDGGARRDTLLQARSAAEARMRDRPEQPVQLLDVIGTTVKLSDLAMHRGDRDGAEAESGRAVDAAADAVRKGWQNVEVAFALAGAHVHRGDVLHTFGDIEGAEGQYRRAIQVFERVAELEGSPRARLGAGRILIQCPVAAVRDPLRAIEHFTRVLEDMGGASAEALRLRIEAQRGLGRDAEVRRDVAQLLDLLPPHDAPRRRRYEQMLR